MNFYELYKRRGTSETLFALYSEKNYSCTLPEFFEKLESEENSYYNAFFRVKDDLLRIGLITYRRNRYHEKVIQLTPKGVKIVRILKEINILFN
jgi:predicted transcriptional regulator